MSDGHPSPSDSFLELRRDEPLLRTALDAGRMNAYEWDVATDRVIRIGDARLFAGVPPAGVAQSGADWFALVHPDDRERLQASIATLTPEECDFMLEYRVIADEVTHWVQDSGRAAFDADGTLINLRGVIADITARREAEGRLLLIATVSEWIERSEDSGNLLYEVSKAVGEHLHARRCFFTELDVAKDRGIVQRDYCRGVASVAGTYAISDYPSATLGELIGGNIVVNCDAKNDPRTASEYARTYEPSGERAYVAVPLLRDARLVAELWIADDRPRQWSKHDVALLHGVAERAWTAVEKLRVITALRESEARMQFVGESAGVGYWYWDVERNKTFWSPVFYRLHGAPETDPPSYEGYLAMVHPDDRPPLERAIQSAIEPGALSDYSVEYRTVRTDGTTRWMQIKGSTSVEHGVTVRLAGIAMDVTDRKLLELEREELLARERRLRAEADEANRTKDNFLALISHELRTPMTTILGWASFITSGASDPATTEKAIVSIEQASHTQSRLIDDLLDVSRIVTDKLTIESRLLDVAEPVREAVEMIQPAARAAGINLTADLGNEPAFAMGDAMRLRQIVGNLLSNAVKFTQAGGEAHVSLEQTGDSIEIRVRDNGAGIDRAFLPHVFERFRQADDGPARRFGGLGLGLSIVRHLVELHGGSVAAASDGPGLGATFTVRLPRAPVASAVTRPHDIAHVAPNALDGVTVLLVDDDRSTRDVLGAILTGYGARVTLAGSAAEALQKYAATHPDVLVSDIGMPGEDGFALIDRLRRAEAQVPAIAVTAYAEPSDRERALLAGFQAYLAKPVEARAVAAAVLHVLGSR